jgi:hypothetical protein
METALLPQIAEAEARVRQLTTPPALSALAGINIDESWESLGVRLRREVVRAVCDLVVSPPIPGVGRFDKWRLAQSRWAGDDRTWGEIWTEAGIS